MILESAIADKVDTQTTGEGNVHALGNIFCNKSLSVRLMSANE